MFKNPATTLNFSTSFTFSTKKFPILVPISTGFPLITFNKGKITTVISPSKSFLVA